MNRYKSSFLKLQRGVSLIEVLITILVLSVGLLGMAGLQIAAVQQNSSAGLRSQAITLAYDISDRVKINNSDGARTKAIYETALANNAPTPVATDPTDEFIADSDVQFWLNSLANTLPSGDGSIAFTADDDQMIVTVCWEDTRADGDAVIDSVASNAACNSNTATFFQFSTDI